MKLPRKLSPTELPLPFEIDDEPLQETQTAWGRRAAGHAGVSLVEGTGQRAATRAHQAARSRSGRGRDDRKCRGAECGERRMRG